MTGSDEEYKEEKGEKGEKDSDSEWEDEEEDLDFSLEPADNVDEDSDCFGYDIDEICSLDQLKYGTWEHWAR